MHKKETMNLNLVNNSGINIYPAAIQSEEAREREREMRKLLNIGTSYYIERDNHFIVIELCFLHKTER